MGTLGPRTQEVRVALNLARGLGNVQRHRGEQQESTATWPSRITLRDQPGLTTCTNDRHRPACSSFTPRGSLGTRPVRTCDPVFRSCSGRSARAVSVRAFACFGYAAENLVDAVHLRASS